MKKRNPEGLHSDAGGRHADVGLTSLKLADAVSILIRHKELEGIVPKAARAKIRPLVERLRENEYQRAVIDRQHGPSVAQSQIDRRQVRVLIELLNLFISRGRPLELDHGMIAADYVSFKQRLKPVRERLRKARNPKAHWLWVRQQDPELAAKIEKAGLKAEWFPQCPRHLPHLRKLAAQLTAAVHPNAKESTILRLGEAARNAPRSTTSANPRRPA